MDNLTNQFTKAKNEFINSFGSEKSVENLYELIYLLKNIEEKCFNENYILAQIYNLVGKNISASKIIEKLLISDDADELQKLNELQSKIDSLYENHNKIKIYRDLRDSKIIKEPTKLNVEDFIINKDNDGTYFVEISNRIKQIVVLNKYLENFDTYTKRIPNFIFMEKEPNNSVLHSLVDYIVWLGKIKDELIVFYKKSSFRHQHYNVGQSWFDGLSVYDLNININQFNSFETEIIIHDYLQNDFGFRLEIENHTFKNIEYDPIL
jgi:hypothetical protein